MMGVHCLPPEIWKMVIRHATSTEESALVGRAHPPPDVESEEPSCLKGDTPLTPVLYHRKTDSSHSAFEAFTLYRTKRSIGLVCRTFNQIVGEFLFERLYISEPKSAHRLAETVEYSELYEDPGKWTRHITIVGVFFTYPPACGELANAAVQILSRTPHLTSFHLSWNATSKEFRERERMIVDAISATQLQRFEWDCTGGGFERQHDHPFYKLLESAKSTLSVLKLNGYLPLAELPMTPSQHLDALQVRDTNNNPDMFPRLTHLKVRRTFRDDLLFISQWSVSNLTCLSLGSIWAYFDQRELAFSFWDTPKPALRCLHLGEGSNVTPQLAHKILLSAGNLKVLEYFYLGEWERDTWFGVSHKNLEVVKVHISHPVIALRSLFNSRIFSREQQWEKFLRHIIPFLGCHESPYEPEYPGAMGVSTRYPAMKRLVFLEFMRSSEELQYKPAELADWLRTTISKFVIKTNVQLVVEAEDYIR